MEHPELAPGAQIDTMASLSKAEIIKRLGMAPDQWEFRGQCYDCGDGNSRVCALTQRATRFCFTLKPKIGKGKANISPASFFMLKRHSPDLYMQLERGRHWLQLMVEAEASAMRTSSLRKRACDTRDKLMALRKTARKHLSDFRAFCPYGELPGKLLPLRALVDRKIPVFQNAETAQLWLESNILELENELLRTSSVRTTREVAATEVERLDTPRQFAPIPEISF